MEGQFEVMTLLMAISMIVVVSLLSIDHTPHVLDS